MKIPYVLNGPFKIKWSSNDFVVTVFLHWVASNKCIGLKRGICSPCRLEIGYFIGEL